MNKKRLVETLTERRKLNMDLIETKIKNLREILGQKISQKSLKCSKRKKLQ